MKNSEPAAQQLRHAIEQLELTRAYPGCTPPQATGKFDCQQSQRRQTVIDGCWLGLCAVVTSTIRWSVASPGCTSAMYFSGYCAHNASNTRRATRRRLSVLASCVIRLLPIPGNSLARFPRNVHNLPRDRRFRGAHGKISAHFETYGNFSAQTTSPTLPSFADGRELGHAAEHQYRRSEGRLSRRQTATRKRVFSLLCRPETESRTTR